MRNFELKLPKKLFTAVGDQPTVDLEAIMTTIAVENAGGGGPTILTASATIDFNGIDIVDYSEASITVTGAVVGDVVALGIPATAMPLAPLNYQAYVSAADTVTIRVSNTGESPVNPASGVFTVKVFQ